MFLVLEEWGVSPKVWPHILTDNSGTGNELESTLQGPQICLRTHFLVSSLPVLIPTECFGPLVKFSIEHLLNYEKPFIHDPNLTSILLQVTTLSKEFSG